MKPFIYADFQNATPNGRIRLNTNGTREDMAKLGLVFEAGMQVTLYTDDGDNDRIMIVDGIVERDATEVDWVAVVDWSNISKTRSSLTHLGVVPSIPSPIRVSLVG